MDNRDESRGIKNGPPPSEGGASRFGGVALPPCVACELPADLHARPTLRIPQPTATEQHAVALALDRPVAVAAKGPVPRVQRHLPPAWGWVDPPADVAHHLRV